MRRRGEARRRGDGRGFHLHFEVVELKTRAEVPVQGPDDLTLYPLLEKDRKWCRVEGNRLVFALIAHPTPPPDPHRLPPDPRAPWGPVCRGVGSGGGGPLRTPRLAGRGGGGLPNRGGGGEVGVSA